MDEEENYYQTYQNINNYIESFYQNKDPLIIDTRKKIHPLIHFRYNSFNVCVGPQCCGKTTFLIRELILLSRLQTPYKAIIYVGSNGLDTTFQYFKDQITIPLYYVEFNEFKKSFTNYIQTRNSEDHVFVIFEDATFLFEHEDKDLYSFFCKLRHYRATFWMNIHIWKNLNPSLKTQISSVYIFKGFSKKTLHYMFSQLSSCLDQSVLDGMYYSLKKHQCLWISNENGKVSII